MNSFRYAIFTFVFTLFTANAIGQHVKFHTQDRHAVLDVADPAAFLLDSVNAQVDSYPLYAAGFDALYAHIYKYVNYPEEAFSRGLGAKVEARFMIDASGKARVLEISREPSEMFRVRVDMAIRNMGKWIPAKVNGQAVDMQMRITVTYDVQQGDADEVHGYGNVDGLMQQLQRAELDSRRPVINFYLPFSYKPYWSEGDEALQRVVEQEIGYPEKALAKGESGTVKTKFMVDANGEVDDVQIKADAKVPNLEKAVRNFLKRSKSWHLGSSFGISGAGYCYVNFMFDAAEKTVKVRTF